MGPSSLPLGHDSGAVPSTDNRMYTNHRNDRDGHWQQSGTPPILSSAPCGPTGPVKHHHGFTGSTKSHLCIVIYNHVVHAFGQCMSVSLILGFNLDFSSCDVGQFM